MNINISSIFLTLLIGQCENFFDTSLESLTTFSYLCSSALAMLMQVPSSEKKQEKSIDSHLNTNNNEYDNYFSSYEPLIPFEYRSLYYETITKLKKIDATLFRLETDSNYVDIVNFDINQNESFHTKPSTIQRLRRITLNHQEKIKTLEMLFNLRVYQKTSNGKHKPIGFNIIKHVQAQMNTLFDELYTNLSEFSNDILPFLLATDHDYLKDKNYANIGSEKIRKIMSLLTLNKIKKWNPALYVLFEENDLLYHEFIYLSHHFFREALFERLQHAGVLKTKLAPFVIKQYQTVSNYFKPALINKFQYEHTFTIPKYHQRKLLRDFFINTDTLLISTSMLIPIIFILCTCPTSLLAFVPALLMFALVFTVRRFIILHQKLNEASDEHKQQAKEKINNDFKEKTKSKAAMIQSKIKAVTKNKENIKKITEEKTNSPETEITRNSTATTSATSKPNLNPHLFRAETTLLKYTRTNTDHTLLFIIKQALGIGVPANAKRAIKYIDEFHNNMESLTHLAENLKDYALNIDVSCDVTWERLKDFFNRMLTKLNPKEQNKDIQALMQTTRTILAFNRIQNYLTATAPTPILLKNTIQQLNQLKSIKPRTKHNPDLNLTLPNTRSLSNTLNVNTDAFREANIALLNHFMEILVSLKESTPEIRDHMALLIPAYCSLVRGYLDYYMIYSNELYNALDNTNALKENSTHIQALREKTDDLKEKLNKNFDVLKILRDTAKETPKKTEKGIAKEEAEQNSPAHYRDALETDYKELESLVDIMLAVDITQEVGVMHEVGMTREENSYQQSVAVDIARQLPAQQQSVAADTAKQLLAEEVAAAGMVSSNQQAPQSLGQGLWKRPASTTTASTDRVTEELTYDVSVPITAAA